MKKILLSLCVATLPLLAYVDSDRDGVEDSIDQCPDTLLKDLVDAKGCPIEPKSDHHYDIILGMSYGESDNQIDPSDDYVFSATAQIDYYYKRFSMQFTTSYYDNDDNAYENSAFYDSVVSMSYKVVATDKVIVKLGAGVVLPTYDTYYDNNNADYFAYINGSYRMGKSTVFAAYSRTTINDDDVNDGGYTIAYQDTNAYSIGTGYNFTPRVYANASYFQSDSLYKGVKDIKKASAFLFYRLDQHWFTTLSYSRGLSDSSGDHYSALKLGYYY